MYLSTTSFIAALGAAAVVSAQSLADLPKCAQNCVGNSLSETGCNSIDIKCICSQKDYISKLSCCVSGSCSKADQDQTIKFASDLCLTYQITVPTVASCPSNGTATSNATASITRTPTPAASASAKSSSTAGAHKEYIGTGIGIAAAGLFAAML